MKKILRHVYDSRVWLGMIMLLNVSFIFLAWLAYPEVFMKLIGLMLALSLVFVLLPLIYFIRREEERETAAKRFLVEPDREQEDVLCKLVSKTHQPFIRQIGHLLRERRDELNEQQMQLGEYEAYIEEWVHEIKKPVSLMTLVLDNRADEMSPLVKQRMTYARNDIQGDVEKILYFSRLRTVHRDYLFQPIDLLTLCQDAVLENQSLLEEASVSVTYNDESQTVVSDRKSLLFMLSQIIANSCEYAVGQERELNVAIENGDQISLTVSDNGPGVPKTDLPFIFDKSFTGGKAKATGMGLYLVKRMADDLKVELRATSDAEGLNIAFLFPKVDH